ncbi:MAG: hypothetical protein LBL35_06765 [Clostridiales bacterium]|nr:hypothetical protein [Clostridiales bacterium]
MKIKNIAKLLICATIAISMTAAVSGCKAAGLNHYVTVNLDESNEEEPVTVEESYVFR